MLLLFGLAAANPLDAWGPHVGAGTLAVNPNVYRDTDGVSELQAIVGYDLSGRFDVQAGVAAALQPDGGTEPALVEVLPRWFVADGVGLVAKGFWSPGDLRVGPEVHLTRPVTPSFDAYVDGGGTWGWRDGESGPEQAFLTAGVEWVAPPRLRPFLETFTEQVAGEATAVYLTPGLYVLLDEAGDHELSVGVRTPVAGDRLAVAGAWYNRNVQLRHR